MLGNCKKENICPDHFPDFNLGSFIIIKSMFIMKNVTDFRKTVETGVNPHLLWGLVYASVMDVSNVVFSSSAVSLLAELHAREAEHHG